MFFSTLLAILATAGPIAGAVMLLARGEWPIVLAGFVAMWVMKYVYIVALLPNLAIMRAASRSRDGSPRPGPAATAFMVFWQAVCLLLWPCITSYAFMIRLGPAWTVPHVLFALGVAFTPVMILAMKDYGNPAALTGPMIALLTWATATVAVLAGAGWTVTACGLLGLFAVSVALVGLNVSTNRQGEAEIPAGVFQGLLCAANVEVQESRNGPLREQDDFPSETEEQSLPASASDVSSAPLSDPELWRLTAKLMAKAIKAGIYSFAEVVEIVEDRFGPERTLKLGPYLQRAWTGLRNMDNAGRLDEARPVEELLSAGSTDREPRDSRLWWMILDNLEDQFPARLDYLLNSGRLKAHLDRTYDQTVQALGRMQEANPHLPFETIAEFVYPDLVTTLNPNREDEALSPEGERLLEAFREKWMGDD